MSQFSHVTRSASALGIAALLFSAQLASAQDAGTPPVNAVPASVSTTVVQVPVAPVLDASGNVILPATGLASTAGTFALVTAATVVGIAAAISGGNSSTSTTN